MHILYVAFIMKRREEAQSLHLLPTTNRLQIETEIRNETLMKICRKGKLSNNLMG